MAVRDVSVAERRARLAVRHRLAPGTQTDDVVTIADDLLALHSTDPVTPYLSVAARMATPDLTSLPAALYEDRTLVRHHAMRRTLWVFPVASARLAQASTTASLHRTERAATAKLLEAGGITTDGVAWLEAADQETLAALRASGPVPARVLGDLVPTLRQPIELAPGTKWSTTAQAHTRVLLGLGFQGLVVRTRPTGTWINGQYQWAAADQWLDGGLVGADPDAAAATLVDHWLRRFGPATTVDIRWWFGWAAVKAKKAIAACGAVPVTAGGEDAWLAAGDEEVVGEVAPWVALLPGLDPTTMGWKGRDWYLDADHVGSAFDRNGNGGPTVWADGRIVGGWVQRPDGTIAIATEDGLGREQRAAVDAAAHHLESLLGTTRFKVRFPAPVQTALLRGEA